MPEGHSIRHFATIHSYGFVGTRVDASSPQGRFADGAARLHGQEMLDTSAHGKHLFLHFEEDTLHIHLGLYGFFAFGRKASISNATAQTRLRLFNDEFVSDLSGPTACDVIDYSRWKDIVAKLGPDPIHDDSDSDKAWSKIHKSSRTIGALLMDQSIIAGIGNVYRAELLFLSKVDPFVPGKNVPREAFDSMWNDAVRLLTLGAVDGKIKTVKPEHMTPNELETRGHSQNSYVYKRTGTQCRVCFTSVQTQDLSGRQLYWCPTCQA
jgi:endonuclease VIII